MSTGATGIRATAPGGSRTGNVPVDLARNTSSGSTEFASNCSSRGSHPPTDAAAPDLFVTVTSPGDTASAGTDTSSGSAAGRPSDSRTGTCRTSGCMVVPSGPVGCPSVTATVPVTPIGPVSSWVRKL